MTSGTSTEAPATREIGSLTVSAVGLGCNNFGWKIDEKQAKEVVDAALDAGITFFDTADIYGDTRSEEILGKALGKRRDQIVIASKFGMEIDEERPGGAEPDYIRKALEGSLKRLGTEVIDLYYLHKPDESVPIADTMETLRELKREGKIREFACSNFSADQLVEAHHASGSKDGFTAVQNEYSLLHRKPEESGVLKACQNLKMAFVPYFPLKSGLLTGKYRKGDEVPEDSRLGTDEGKFSGMGDQLLTSRNLDLVEKLIEYAETHDRTILELAFSWLLSKPMVASVIAGATTPEQVYSNVNASGWHLTADELAEIDGLTLHP